MEDQPAHSCALASSSTQTELLIQAVSENQKYQVALFSLEALYFGLGYATQGDKLGTKK